MRINRVYQPIELFEGALIALDKSASLHIGQVLRMRQGEPIILFNGNGGEYLGAIESVSKNSVSVVIEKFDSVEREYDGNIHLAQSVSRGDKMDFTLQKAVELGVKEITPILSARCGVKLSAERWAKKITHWKKIIISACEQCGRNQIPLLHKPQTLDFFLKNYPKDQDKTLLILDHRAERKISTLNLQKKRVTLLIGPEGGFTPLELEAVSSKEILSARLGPSILRTETAGLAAISAIQVIYHNF